MEGLGMDPGRRMGGSLEPTTEGNDTLYSSGALDPIGIMDYRWR